MTREQAIETLRVFNEWRKDDMPAGEGLILPSPKEIGQALELAILIMETSSETETAGIYVGLEKKRIEDAGVSTYTLNRCQRVGIKTVYDLAGWPRKALIRARGVGGRTFRELERLLEKYGLTFGMWESKSFLDYKESMRKKTEEYYAGL
jgi:DNA-directed RNA polymerase alpha subunit